MMAGESGTSKTGAPHYYYKCGNHKRNGKQACDLKAVRKEPLERFVVKTAIEQCLTDACVARLVDKLLAYQDRENTRIPVLQAELKDVQRRINNMVAAIEEGIITPATKERLSQLEQRKEQLELSIAQEQLGRPRITREQMEFFFSQFQNGDPEDRGFQQQVIDCFVNSVYIFDDRVVVNFNCTGDDDTPVTLEEVTSSFLTGNAAPCTPLKDILGGVFFERYL